MKMGREQWWNQRERERERERETERKVKSKGQFYMEGIKRASLVRRFPGFARSSFWQQW